MAYKCNEALAVDDGHHGRCVKRGATTMGNMFDNLGKGLNDFTKQAGKIAGNIGDTAGKITKDVAKGAGKLAGDAGKMTAAVAGSVAQSAAVASGEVSKAADSMAKGTVSIVKTSRIVPIRSICLIPN